MKSYPSMLAMFSLATILVGCDSSTDTPASQSPAPTSSAVATPAAPQAPAAVRDANTRYRRVEAQLRENGEPVEILVPEDIQFGSGRLIEIREGAGGEYYFVSLIPE